MRGKLNLFGPDALANMAAATGRHIEIRVLEAARSYRNSATAHVGYLLLYCTCIGKE